jgi:hypothetical protein
MPLLMLLGLIVLAVVLYLWLKKSPKFDKFCKDLLSDNAVEVPAKNKIKDITSTEKDLSKQVEQNAKQAEQLEKESDGINDFLGKRGVVEDAKKKEDS